MLKIRLATNADHDAVWNIFHAVVAPGDTYSFDPQIYVKKRCRIGSDPARIPMLRKMRRAFLALTS
jgi:hypothetical protein